MVQYGYTCRAAPRSNLQALLKLFSRLLTGLGLALETLRLSLPDDSHLHGFKTGQDVLMSCLTQVACAASLQQGLLCSKAKTIHLPKQSENM